MSLGTKAVFSTLVPTQLLTLEQLAKIYADLKRFAIEKAAEYLKDWREKGFEIREVEPSDLSQNVNDWEWTVNATGDQTVTFTTPDDRVTVLVGVFSKDDDDYVSKVSIKVGAVPVAEWNLSRIYIYERPEGLSELWVVLPPKTNVEITFKVRKVPADNKVRIGFIGLTALPLGRVIQPSVSK